MEDNRDRERQRRFARPPEIDEDLNADTDDLLDDEAFLDPAERRERRIGRLRFAAGFGDLIGVVTGSLAVLALLALILSLISWVQQDITQTAILLGSGL